jgi:hypothetical protein
MYTPFNKSSSLKGLLMVSLYGTLASTIKL